MHAVTLLGLLVFNGVMKSSQTSEEDLMNRYNYLLEIDAQVAKIEQSIAMGIFEAKEETVAKPKNITWKGKAKEFTNRQYVGFYRGLDLDVSGLCASRVHPGYYYFVINCLDRDLDQYDSSIYILDLRDGVDLINTIKLDVVSVDWEDIACGPCDQDGSGHCIYIADTGHSTGEPANLIYKVEEPDVIIPMEEMLLGEDRIELLPVESGLENCKTLLVSPSGRIFLMDVIESDAEGYPLYELKDSSLEKVTDVALYSEWKGPVSADISPDGKGFLFKMEENVFHWYVEDKDDLADVLQDEEERMKLAYWPETDEGHAIAWRLDGGAYFTFAMGDNKPVYRYDRIA